MRPDASGSVRKRCDAVGQFRKIKKLKNYPRNSFFGILRTIEDFEDDGNIFADNQAFWPLPLALVPHFFHASGGATAVAPEGEKSRTQRQWQWPKKTDHDPIILEMFPSSSKQTVS